MQGTNEIVSSMETINTILLDNSVYYFIPEFQRSFVWGQKEINELITDFIEDTDNFTVDTSNLEGYLLGNIVLIDQGKKKIVIDGQQRLTTLSLFARGIFEVLNERAIAAGTDLAQHVFWSKKTGDIEKGFYILDDSDNHQGLKIQHDPSLSFGNLYQQLISKNLTKEERESLVVKSEDKNIDTVFSRIYEFLGELDDDQFQHFISFFKTKIKIIVTSAPTEAKAFQLFEILNDRGRSLEPMDLIKNSFLKVLNVEGRSDIQISTFNKDWQIMMDNLQLSKKRKIASSTFLKQYLIAFRGVNLKAEKLFEYFKDSKNGFDGNTILDFVSKMRIVSGLYKEIELGNYSDFLDDQNMYIIFELFGIRQFHPILMIFYGESDDKKKRILDAITRWGASVLFSYTQTNYIEKNLPVLIKNYWNTYQNDKDAALDNMIQDINNSINELTIPMKANIANRNFVGKNGEVHSRTLMMLIFIELYFNKNNAILSVPKGKSLTVEHILSRNIDTVKNPLSELGFDSEEDKKNNIHRFGNLTLMYNTDNSSVGNGSFDEKKMAYSLSSFRMTSTLVAPLVTTVKNGIDTKLYDLINKYEHQYIISNGQWTKDLIEKRSNDMAELLEDIVRNQYK